MDSGKVIRSIFMYLAKAFAATNHDFLTNFMSLVPFCTPWKHRFSDVFREYRKRLWHDMD